MSSYVARVSRQGKWWMISVPDIDGLTQARRLAEVEPMARDLIAVTLDVDPDSFDVDVQLEAIEDVRVTERLDALASSREEMEAAKANYSEALRGLARDMSRNGLTVRDIGALLGVSFQRAQQLLDA